MESNHSKELEKLFLSYGYEIDFQPETNLVFKRKLNCWDSKNIYAFSQILVFIDDISLRIEGINEPLVRNAIRAGIIEVKSSEDVDELLETIFETTHNELERLDAILPFLHQQLKNLEEQKMGSDAYLNALANIELLVDAANSID